MQPHPQTEQLRERFRNCLDLVKPWSGTFYRASRVEYANRKDLVAGIGSRRAGGRWNSPGRFNAVYGSLEPETAMAEALASHRQFGVPVSEALPLVFVAITVDLQAVLDLTDPDVHQRLGVTLRRMISTPWRTFQWRDREAFTQALGRTAWEERLEAILVPSAQVRGARNLVLFPGRRRPGSSWRIQGARGLPPGGAH